MAQALSDGNADQSLNPQDSADYRLIDDQIALNLLEFRNIQNYKHNPTVYVECWATACSCR